MSERAEFHVRGQPLDGTPLHYTASGLDYVYLLNGFTVENDPDYGEILTINAVDDLHRAIGLSIISQQRALTGAEFRFLRKQMKLRQKDLAPRLGVNEQTVANYEKNKNIPVTSEILMRMVFLLWLTPPDERADVLKQLGDHVQQVRARRDANSVSPPRTDVAYAIAKQWQMGGMVCPA